MEGSGDIEVVWDEWRQRMLTLLNSHRNRVGAFEHVQRITRRSILEMAKKAAEESGKTVVHLTTDDVLIYIRNNTSRYKKLLAFDEEKWRKQVLQAKEAIAHGTPKNILKIEI